MNQSELKKFFAFCEDNIKTFKVEDCEESEHYYIGSERIGWHAGDSGEFFLDNNNITAKAIRMMDAASDFDKEVEDSSSMGF